MGTAAPGVVARNGGGTAAAMTMELERFVGRKRLKTGHTHGVQMGICKFRDEFEAARRSSMFFL